MTRSLTALAVEVRSTHPNLYAIFADWSGADGVKSRFFLAPSALLPPSAYGSNKPYYFIAQDNRNTTKHFSQEIEKIGGKPRFLVPLTPFTLLPPSVYGSDKPCSLYSTR
jgi:hypothetical protein